MTAVYAPAGTVTGAQSKGSVAFSLSDCVYNNCVIKLPLPCSPATPSFVTLKANEDVMLPKYIHVKRSVPQTDVFCTFVNSKNTGSVSVAVLVELVSGGSKILDVFAIICG